MSVFSSKMATRPCPIGSPPIIAYCFVPDRPHAAPHADKHASYAFMLLGGFYEEKDAFDHIKRLKKNGFKAFEPKLARVGLFMPTYRILNPDKMQRIAMDKRVIPMLQSTINAEKSQEVADGPDLPSGSMGPTRDPIVNVAFIDEKADPMQYRPTCKPPGQNWGLFSFITRAEHEYRTRQICPVTSLALLGVFSSKDAGDVYISSLADSGHDDVAIWGMPLEQWELLPPVPDPQKSRQCLRHILRSAIHAFNQKNEGVINRGKKYEEAASVKTVLKQRGAQKKAMEELQKLRDSGFKIPYSISQTRVIDEQEFEELKRGPGSAAIIESSEAELAAKAQAPEPRTE